MELKDVVNLFLTIILFALGGIASLGLMLIKGYYRGIETRILAIEYAVGMRVDKRTETKEYFPERRKANSIVVDKLQDIASYKQRIIEETNEKFGDLK